jgi:stress-induced morphogen
MYPPTLDSPVHRTYPALAEDHKRREAGKAFAHRVEDHAIKIQLLLGREKMVNEALRQVLDLHAVLLAARTFWGNRRPPPGEETR